MGAQTKFYVRPGEGELVETTVHLSEDRRAALRGTVLDEDGKPISNVCVAVFDTAGCASFKDYIPVDMTYTADDGSFFSGPLQPQHLYAVYVYKNGIRIRQLELLM